MEADMRRWLVGAGAALTAVLLVGCTASKGGAKQAARNDLQAKAPAPAGAAAGAPRAGTAGDGTAGGRVASGRIASGRVASGPGDSARLLADDSAKIRIA